MLAMTTAHTGDPAPSSMAQTSHWLYFARSSASRKVTSATGIPHAVRVRHTDPLRARDSRATSVLRAAYWARAGAVHAALDRALTTPRRLAHRLCAMFLPTAPEGGET